MEICVVKYKPHNTGDKDQYFNPDLYDERYAVERTNTGKPRRG